MPSPAFAALLATSLLRACACDARVPLAPAARRLKAGMPPWPRPDARELREEIDRRLSAPAFSEPEAVDGDGGTWSCLAACPGLQALQSDIMTASAPLFQSSGGEGGESTAEIMVESTAEVMAGIMEITMDMFCTHRPAVQCVVDSPSACSAGVDEILELAPKLDCLCDACPSARPALAHLTGTFMPDFAVDYYYYHYYYYYYDDDSYFSGTVGTTTQMFDAGTTTDIGDGVQDDLTGGDIEMMCAVYPLLSCAVNQPTQCGGGVLAFDFDFDFDFDVHDVTAAELAQMEETCPNVTMTSGTDGDNDDHNSSDSSPSQTPEGESDSSSTTIVEETSNCGFISLGWLSASLPLMVTVLRFDAAR